MTPSRPDGPAPADPVVPVVPGIPGVPRVVGAPDPVALDPVAVSGRPSEPDPVAALRAERIRVAHWRRLVRARTDLAVAAIALPEELGRHGVDVPGGPDRFGALDGGVDDPPPYLFLLDAVSAGGPEGEIDRLEALHALDERLARYGDAVGHALRTAAGAGVPRQAGEPAAAPTRGPGAERPGPGPMGQTVPRT